MIVNQISPFVEKYIIAPFVSPQYVLSHFFSVCIHAALAEALQRLSAIGVFPFIILSSWHSAHTDLVDCVHWGNSSSFTKMLIGQSGLCAFASVGMIVMVTLCVKYQRIVIRTVAGERLEAFSYNDSCTLWGGCISNIGVLVDNKHSFQDFWKSHMVIE